MQEVLNANAPLLCFTHGRKLPNGHIYVELVLTSVARLGTFFSVGVRPLHDHENDWHLSPAAYKRR